MANWRDSEPMTMWELIKLHGEGIKIISESEELDGTEIWSNVRIVDAQSLSGKMWRQNAGKDDGRNVGEFGISRELASRPIWHRYDMSEVVPETDAPLNEGETPLNQLWTAFGRPHPFAEEDILVILSNALKEYVAAQDALPSETDAETLADGIKGLVDWIEELEKQHVETKAKADLVDSVPVEHLHGNIVSVCRDDCPGCAWEKTRDALRRTKAVCKWCKGLAGDGATHGKGRCVSTVDDIPPLGIEAS
jgi:hypothetical protein